MCAVCSAVKCLATYPSIPDDRAASLSPKRQFLLQIGAVAWFPRDVPPAGGRTLPVGARHRPHGDPGSGPRAHGGAAQPDGGGGRPVPAGLHRQLPRPRRQADRAVEARGHGLAGGQRQVGQFSQPHQKLRTSCV